MNPLTGLCDLRSLGYRTYRYPANEPFDTPAYQICITCCTKRLTTEIPIQQQNPIKIGFPPVFTSLTIFVLNPIATIAITMKNLLKSFNGVVTLTGKEHTVVTTDANTKNTMKNGKIFFSRKVPFASTPSRFAFHICRMARIKVIGMIASVLVSFTIVAVSNVLLP